MCLIAWRPVKEGRGGSNIPNDVIDTALQRHPDGFGVAWREDGGLHVERFGPTQQAEFRALVKDVDKLPGEYVAHFRFATHGPKAASHSHPYEYMDPEEGRVLVFHNGVIDITTKPNESDTEVFVRDILAHLPSRWWEQPALQYLVHEAIGWSKLIVMTAKVTVSLQDSRGEWDSGIWYSSDHKPDKWTQWTRPAVSGKGAIVGSHASYCNCTICYMKRSEIREATKWPDSVWVNGGHIVYPVVDIPYGVEGAYQDGVVCEACQTSGDVFVLDGAMHFDMAHMYGASAADWDDDDEDAESLRELYGEDFREMLPLGSAALVRVN